MNNYNTILFATAGGTLASVSPQLLSLILLDDLLKTALLATVGATVSFTISLLLRYIVRRCKGK